MLSKKCGGDAPGAITLIRMFCFAYSFAIAREKPNTACFDAHWRRGKRRSKLRVMYTE